MSDTIQQITHDLAVEAQKMTLKASIVGSVLRVTWTLPPTYTAYDGAVVVISQQKFTDVNYPEDGKRYVASSNALAPADSIGGAQVVFSAYGYFGDDLTVTSVDVSGIDPTKVYYAALYPASNILQYSSPGVVSYPLDVARQGRVGETYAGSIPDASAPPANPKNGQAYFDRTVNRVLVWNSASSTWVETNSGTVPTGDIPPIGPNQVFFDTTAEALKFFIGGTWVICNPTNTRVRFGNTYVPLGTVQLGYTSVPTPGDIVYVSIPAPVGTIGSPALFIYTLGQWLPFTANLVQFETAPATWTQVVTCDPVSGSTLPPVPAIGDFFYKTRTQDLLVWSGDDWVKSDTEDEGVPMTDKVGIGTDGSQYERTDLINILKLQMGYPATCVELSEEQFNVAINNALDEFRRRADNAYTNQFILMTMNKGQNVYYLNDPRLKTDKVVNVLAIHRVSQLGINSLGGTGNLYSQPFVQQFYNGSQVDVLSIHLMGQLSETFDKIFAGNLSFTWNEATRQLLILRDITNTQERVVVETVMERTDQDLLVDRWAKQWLQGWAHSELKFMLGMIRTKYSSVPGPTGGLSLNGDLLISEARQDQDELLRQITDYEVGNGGLAFGNAAFYIG